MKKLVPIILAVLGLAIGVGAGYSLRPAEEVVEAPSKVEVDPELVPEFVKLNNQFVIPVVEGAKVASIVILSLSLEVKQGTTEKTFKLEPKLRDAFLRTLFDHANAGGFSGTFTDGAALIVLRKALLETASGILGEDVSDVLVSDIARQDA